MRFILLLLPLLAYSAETPESIYLKKRDEFIAQFKGSKESVDDADRKALEELDTLIHRVLPEPAPAGFGGSGHSNLQTLQPEIGFGMLDGLQFHMGDESVVVTTPSLLARFHEKKSLSKEELSKITSGEEIYQWAHLSGSAFYHFNEIPVSTKTTHTLAKAFLSIEGQDCGDSPPEELLVFVEKGSRDYFYQVSLKPKLPQLSACVAEYKKAAGDPKTLTGERHDKGCEAYRKCYIEKFPKEKAYKELSTRAQKIVDRF